MSIAVEVWSVDLAAGLPALLRLEAEAGLLSEEDRARVATLSDPAEADRRLGASIALRTMLAGVIRADLRGIAFSREPAGKPFLPGGGCHFSLAHSTDTALVAIASERVGVDVESPRSVSIGEERRVRIETAARLLGGDLPGASASPQMHFLHAWTRLEALAKADGRGIGWLLGEIAALGPGRSGLAHQEVERRMAALTASFTILDLAVSPEHPAALCVNGYFAGADIHLLPSDLDGLRTLIRTRRRIF